MTLLSPYAIQPRPKPGGKSNGLVAAAIHEAGHVVAAHEVGVLVGAADVRLVSVEEGFNADGLFVRGGQMLDGMTWTSHEGFESVHPPAVTTRADALRCVTLLMAGAAASLIHGSAMQGRPEPWDFAGTTGDVYLVREYLVRAAPRCMDPTHHLREMRTGFAAATGILRWRWHDVMRVAELLVRNVNTKVDGDTLLATVIRAQES